MNSSSDDSGIPLDEGSSIALGGVTAVIVMSSIVAGVAVIGAAAFLFFHKKRKRKHVKEITPGLTKMKSHPAESGVIKAKKENDSSRTKGQPADSLKIDDTLSYGTKEEIAETDFQDEPVLSATTEQTSELAETDSQDDPLLGEAKEQSLEQAETDSQDESFSVVTNEESSTDL